MNKNPYGEWAFVKGKKKAAERDGHKCVYCGSTKKLVTHHLKPLRLGGTHDLYNLITLCRSCHQIEHESIRECGCCMIPGPDWEPYRELITIPADVDKFRQELIDLGYKPEF